MKKSLPQKITTYYDQDEKDLINSIETAASTQNYTPQSVMTPENVEKYRKAAQKTLREKTVPVTLRLAQSDLIKLKAQAMREGIPYQTWIKSILHKSVAHTPHS